MIFKRKIYDELINLKYTKFFLSLMGLILRWSLLGIFINNRLSLLFTLRSLVNIEFLTVRFIINPSCSY